MHGPLATLARGAVPRCLLAAACLMTLAAAAAAQPRLDCSRATSTPEINACVERDLERADRALNEAYRAMTARIDGSDNPSSVRAEWRKALQDSQRKWIAFRDADCDGAVAFEWYGGTGATAAVLGCKQQKTEARTKELRERTSP